MLSIETDCIPCVRAIFLSLSPFLVPFWPTLDTVACNGLLSFLHGALKVAFSYVAAVLVADRIEWNHLCEVVFIAIFFFQRTVDICLSAVVIRVVLGIE